MNVIKYLKDRGLIEQMTHPEEITELFNKKGVKVYIGFDPTADSLHIGHIIQIIILKHLQNFGHIPVALIGGGTGKIGDPTFKSDMRKLMGSSEVEKNAKNIEKQIKKYLGEDAIYENNANWFDELSYIPFIREIGKHFNVNQMLQAECFKTRMKKGLSFLEFNYMIMQAYDFMLLNDKHGINVEFGGNDQWSNIIAGVNLIRKIKQKDSFGVTFKLLTNSEGNKMGKTEKGALWIDKNKTTPYEIFQYFRNVDDRDVINCLYMLTFLPTEEIKEMEKLEGQELNKAKEILAYEVVKFVHSKEDADKALDASKALFQSSSSMENVPTKEIDFEMIKEGIELSVLLKELELVKSKSEAKRLISQNGIKVNQKVVSDQFKVITIDDFNDDKIMINKGKKIFLQVKVRGIN